MHRKGSVWVHSGLAKVGGLVFCAFLVFCGKSGSGGEEEGPIDETIRTVIRNVGENIILPGERLLRDSLSGLEAALVSWSQAPEDEERRAMARARFREIIPLLERTELFQLGPAAPSGTSPEAADLRD
ncbi:MAG: hypothetical protein N2515_07515, partial [Deltaproteobacteria bacterium]|nr:hypothetical protein [Deltaproteobacteria bacterium]